MPLTLERVYREHVDFVARVARHLRVPDASIDDVVHEVFLVLHRRLDHFDGRTSLRSWIYGITRRVALNHARKQKRVRIREALFVPPSDAGDTAPPTEQWMQRREQVRRVETVLQAMDEGQRMALVLVDIEGLSGPEAADALGLKLNTLYSRLRLARRKLEAELGGPTGGRP